MYGLGILRMAPRLMPDGVTDGVDMVVSEDPVMGVGVGRDFLRGPSFFQPPQRLQLPRTVGVAVSDDPIPVPVPVPAPVPVPMPAPVPVPVAVVPIAWEGSPSAGVPLWMWAVGLGGAFLLFKGAK